MIGVATPDIEMGPALKVGLAHVLHTVNSVPTANILTTTAVYAEGDYTDQGRLPP